MEGETGLMNDISVSTCNKGKLKSKYPKQQNPATLNEKWGFGPGHTPFVMVERLFFGLF